MKRSWMVVPMLAAAGYLQGCGSDDAPDPGTGGSGGGSAGSGGKVSGTGGAGTGGYGTGGDMSGGSGGSSTGGSGGLGGAGGDGSGGTLTGGSGGLGGAGGMGGMVPECSALITPPNDLNGSTERQLGATFTAESTITIDALGVFEFIGTYISMDGPVEVDGMSQAIHVGLYDSTDTLVRDVMVQVDDPKHGLYRYASITPITIDAEDTFSVVAVFAEGDYFGYSETDSPDYDPRISFSSMQSGSNGPLPSSPPGNSDSWSDEYVSVNIHVCD